MQELIEFKFAGLILQEPMALITNWMMSFFCLYAFLQLPKTVSKEVKLWKNFFLWFAVSTFFGGLGHLFYQQFGVLGKYPNWITGVLAGFFPGYAMLIYYKASSLKKFLKLFLFVKGIVLLFLGVTLQKFIFIAIDGILTYVIYCGIIGYALSLKVSSTYRFMYYGVLVCVPSVFIFLFKINIHRWLNKDDLSHLLMLGCLFFFYLGVKYRSEDKLITIKD